MNKTSRIRIVPALLSMLLLLIPASTPAGAQKAATPAEITDLETSLLIPVEFRIRAKDQHLFLPIYKKDELGKFVLGVSGAVTVERFEGTRWVKIKPGYPGEIFGLETERKYADLAPGEYADFHFNINPDFHHVHKGDKLRLSVSYWNDLQTMNNGKEAGKLFSPAFVCP